MQTWGIIGQGWLGGEVANRLTSLGLKWWGTDRTVFKWGVDDFPATPSDILLLNTPPLTEAPPLEFVRQIPPELPSRILFVSSISVYGSQAGTVTEKSPLRPETGNARWLVEVERLLMERLKGNLSIIRPGGLIGGDRHPVFFLAGRSRSVEDGPINLIHRSDLVGIILAVSKIEPVVPVLNAVTPYHPLKSAYYREWCERLGLPEIRFSGSGQGKTVESEILNSIYPDWLVPRLDQIS